MSTPPFVTLPHGVERVDFAGTFGPLSGLVSRPTGDAVGVGLLIPGFTGSKEDFVALLPLLSATGWAVGTFDLRGQYESAGPADLGGYPMSAFVADALNVARDLRERFGQPVHLVGHSFGGLVARATILEAAAGPGRELFRSLTLLASGAGAVPGDLQVVCRQLLNMLPTTPLNVVWALKDATERATRPEAVPDAVSHFMRHRFETNSPFGLAGKAKILVDEPDRVDALAGVLASARIPALVAFGEHDDRWPPSEQADMARRLRARCVVWPSTGHSPNSEHPDWCATVLNGFWSDTANLEPRPIRPADVDPRWPRGLISRPIGYTAGMELRTPVTASPSGVGETRHAIGRQLRAWGLIDAVDDLQLIVTELITNALRHGCGPIELRLEVLDCKLRLEVSDCDPINVPAARESADDVPGGRGMPLIEALATAWGVDVTSTGKVVWAEIAIGQ